MKLIVLSAPTVPGRCLMFNFLFLRWLRITRQNQVQSLGARNLATIAHRDSDEVAAAVRLGLDTLGLHPRNLDAENSGIGFSEESIQVFGSSWGFKMVRDPDGNWTVEEGSFHRFENRKR